VGAGFGGALKAEAALGGGFGVVGVGGLGDGHGHVVVWFFGEGGGCGWWGDCFRHGLRLFRCSDFADKFVEGIWACRERQTVHRIAEVLNLKDWQNMSLRSMNLMRSI